MKKNVTKESHATVPLKIVSSEYQGGLVKIGFGLGLWALGINLNLGHHLFGQFLLLVYAAQRSYGIIDETVQ
jgi:hypothetical protein